MLTNLKTTQNILKSITFRFGDCKKPLWRLKDALRLVFLADKTLLSSFKVPIFAYITAFLFSLYISWLSISNLRRKFELLLFSTLFIGGGKL